MKRKRNLDDTQLAALIAAGAIMVCFVTFWFAEIQAVREMLELAYG